MERILADGEATFLIGGKAIVLRRHFIDDVGADLHRQIHTLHPALLVIRSQADNTVVPIAAGSGSKGEDGHLSLQSDGD